MVEQTLEYVVAQKNDPKPIEIRRDNKETALEAINYQAANKGYFFETTAAITSGVLGATYSWLATMNCNNFETPEEIAISAMGAATIFSTLATIRVLYNERVNNDT